MDNAWRNTTPRPAEDRGGLRSVSMALNLLECFAADEELGVSDLARRLGIAKSTTHRLLSTLKMTGFIEQDARTGLYRLGLHLFELGHLAQIRHPLRDVGLRICRDLHRRTALTVNLSVPDGADIVFIERVESASAPMALYESGQRLPAHVASSGKVIAAWNAEFAAARVASGFPPRARLTVRTATEWEAAIKLARMQGYATSEDESFDGTSSVAVPILSAEHDASGAISFFGLTQHLEPRMPLLVQLLRHSARRISHEMMRRQSGRS